MSDLNTVVDLVKKLKKKGKTFVNITPIVKVSEFTNIGNIFFLNLR